MVNRLLYFLFCFCTFFSGGCRKESAAPAAAQLHLQLTHTVDGNMLNVQQAYQNHFGESFTVNRLKYYVSNIELLRGGGRVPLANTYFLIDEASDSSKNIWVPIPDGTYEGVRFLLGVDSIRNVSGAQTGALDPALDMFWTWNTGYIMAKLEGQSPLSTAPNNRIQYHLGGFAGPYSSLRTVTLSFPAPITIQNSNNLHVALQTEVQNWFDGVHAIKIKDEAVSMSPDERSARFADNAASMFYLSSAAVE